MIEHDLPVAKQHPAIAWMRLWAFKGEKRPTDDRGRFVAVSIERVLPDDVPLVPKEEA